MKKNISILKLAIRNSFRWAMALMGITAAIQCGLFAIAMARVARWDAGQQGLEAVLSISGMPFAAILSAVALVILLALPWSEVFGSYPKSSLNRLDIPNKKAAVWICVYDIACFVIFWAVQLAVYIGTSSYYLYAAGAEYPLQVLFLASWRVGYFHTLLPLSDMARLAWVLSVVLMLGLSAANSGLARTKKNLAANLCGNVIIIINMWENEYEFFDIAFTVLALAFAAASAAGIYHACQSKDEPPKERKNIKDEFPNYGDRLLAEKERGKAS